MMLKLVKIRKVYEAGGEEVEALKGISVEFRKQEFVSILGQSGCGKTTLLNIIGGLDQYTSGDLIINDRSTKQYGDRDWDTYRNHSVGFVFQSYNLIPHQSVLSNVELALTISGVSRKERRRRAAAALTRVGLGNQLYKKPNQMSGGQMQRVAIARAIVNNPEILLADEPTGALDSVTSIQIMDLLREISKDRLVIMVTHNPELAEKYSTRIIRLSDGRLLEDSNPFDGMAEEPLPEPKRRLFGRRSVIPTHKELLPAYSEPKQETVHQKKRASMSFFTALSLSFKNLLTKKTRTILTAFAGSIGIIGIALIQSVSAGVQSYINQVQEDTLSSYPITIQAEEADMTALLSNMMNVDGGGGATHDLDRVYANSVLFQMMNSLTQAEVAKNNLRDFKKFLDSDTELQNYVSAIQYMYGSGLNFYTEDENGTIYKSSLQELMKITGLAGSTGSNMGGGMASYFSSFGTFTVFEEMLPGEDGKIISDLVTDQYDLVYGHWPTAYNEVVLVVDKNNEISDLSLYALGLRSAEDFKTAMQNYFLGKEIETGTEKSWSYEEICEKNYRMILPADCYQKSGDGTYVDISETEAGMRLLYESKGVNIKVSGIIRKNADALSSMLDGTIAYTTLLTDYMLEKTAESAIIQAQLADPTVDVLTGLPFRSESGDTVTATEKTSAVTRYFSALTTAEKAAFYIRYKSIPSESYLDEAVNGMLASMSRAEIETMIIENYAAQMGVTDTSQIEQYIRSLDDETLYGMVEESLREGISKRYAEQVQASLSALPEAQLAAMLEQEVAGFTTDDYAMVYDRLLPNAYSESTYEEVLETLGYVDAETPTGIRIYAATFQDKEKISTCIERYNRSVSEENEISYTDYVALLMSSISTVISAISYVLIAFVAISLIVSSIMISIITYISVLERTKEIGVLRAIGASKKDVSHVFNAETVIEGFVSGALGIGVTLLLLLPINAILHSLTGIASLSAVLPVWDAVILILISMVLTVVAGFIPARMAAKRDPVAALRSE